MWFSSFWKKQMQPESRLERQRKLVAKKRYVVDINVMCNCPPLFYTEGVTLVMPISVYKGAFRYWDSLLNHPDPGEFERSDITALCQLMPQLSTDFIRWQAQTVERAGGDYYRGKPLLLNGKVRLQLVWAYFSDLLPTEALSEVIDEDYLLDCLIAAAEENAPYLVTDETEYIVEDLRREFRLHVPCLDVDDVMKGLRHNRSNG
ncbi:hypothetical protein [Kyrpidia sp.]|uniref:hypothetical protein n=1 Tax=Kyrpidia sp. TaxID=2073077 RepID=UPI00258ACC6B|nr:hypothetical protein [Kyrpidia sp.]MCL6574783.1 hypothetical protein [Kyrpidia sp.]